MIFEQALTLRSYCGNGYHLADSVRVKYPWLKDSLISKTGKEVISTNFLVDRDRDKLLLRKLTPETSIELDIEASPFNLNDPIQLKGATSEMK